MDCPRAHALYELERGAADRDDAERLRRHTGACAPCRDRAEDLRVVAARLERLAARTRADLSPEAEEALFRRARVHGLIGRPLRRPVLLRLARHRGLRHAGLAAAAVIVAALVGLAAWWARPVRDVPAGALGRLESRAPALATVEDLAALAPAARAAVGQALAQAEPDPRAVTDLLLVTYITSRPREDRQTDDVRFLLAQVRQRGGMASRRAAVQPAWAVPALTWPLAGAVQPGDLQAARARLLAGDYDGALAAAGDEGDPILRAWCLAMLGRSGDAAELLARAEAGPREAVARALWAQLALESHNVAEAMRQYERLAEQDDRYWFASGYLARYELGDLRGAGLRLGRVQEPALAAYVAKTFQAELAAARHGPLPLVAETFDDYDTGEPVDWVLVRTRGGEFRIVDRADGGRALQQDEAGRGGAELLTGVSTWGNYTLQFDVQVVEARGEYRIGAAAYRQADGSGYVLELAPRSLRLVKHYAADGAISEGEAARPERLTVAPQTAELRLQEPPAPKWWYTLKLRVQRTADGMTIAGRLWRTDTAEPPTWQVVWTDAGQAGPPLAGGLAGFQVAGARVLVDNLVITRNGATDLAPLGAARAE